MRAILINLTFYFSKLESSFFFSICTPPLSQGLRSKAASGVTSGIPFIEFVYTILPH